MHVRQTFMSRIQQEKEDWVQFLDALEGLRTQGFPDEPITTRRYEIRQRFIDSVSNPTLQQELAVVYAAESYLTEPPTVESLRFTTRRLQRHRPTTSKPYDPRYACSGPVFCVNCGMTEHSASQCQNIPVHEDLAYSLWAEQPSAPPQTLSDSEMVLMLRPAEAAHVATPLTVTCGKIQIQTNPEPTTFDPSGRTIVSVRLLLAIERKTRPELIIDALIDEMTANENYQQLTLPQPEEWQVKGVTSTYHAYARIPVKVCIDGVDMRFGATIITDAFPPGICLGPRELRCYNIDTQEPSGEARIDERASLVVSFVVLDAAPVPLRGLIDTGSGVFILTFSAYNRIAVRTGKLLRPYCID